jgi:spore maturation protein CgeB
MRAQNVIEAKALGAKNVMRVFMTADEITHAPRVLTEEDYKQWSSEVLFVGTWMPERGSFLLKLIKLGIPLSIRGSSWQRSPEWHELKKYWQPAVYGDDYAKAIQCAKINLGLLSKGNRDLHTTRSSEIPSFGGLLCSERTSEHTSMYEEGKEALFWSDAAECAKICKLALTDDDGRQAIVKAGHERVIRNGQFNEVMLSKIIMNVVKLYEV